MLKKILVFMIAPILFYSPYAYSANLTDNFLAGKERDVGESLDWDIALKSPHAATVIHGLIYQDTVIFIEPKTLVYASHNVKKYLPENVEVTQSILNYAFLQAIAEFTTDVDRTKLMNQWIEQHVSPTLTTTLVPSSVSYLNLSQISTINVLKKLRLRVLLPRPRETFPSQKQE